MPIFPGPSSGGAAILDVMVPLTAAVDENGVNITSTSLADGTPGLQYDLPGGFISILLELTESQNWSGVASWPVAIPQSALDAGSVTVSVEVEVYGSVAPASATLGINGWIVPQDVYNGDYVEVIGDPTSYNLVATFGQAVLRTFTVDLTGTAPLAIMYFGLAMQVESAGAGQFAGMRIYSVRVAEAGA